MFTSVDEPFLFTSCIKFGLLVMPFLIMEYNIINYFRFVKPFDKLDPLVAGRLLAHWTVLKRIITS